MVKRKVLVTGATGFVGKRLCEKLESDGDVVIRALRAPGNEDGIVVGDLHRNPNWSRALEGVDVVVHLAARVHKMKENNSDVSQVYNKINVSSTLDLAAEAAKSGVKRIVFLSSVKVNGEITLKDEPFREEDTPAPQDPYAISKLEAENGLFEVAKNTGIEIVIIRSPLVYGPGVKANFLSLLKLVSKGIPIPLGNINNKRSLIALDNLVDLITVCSKHKKAANEVFLAADGVDISTTELIRQIGYALDKPAILFPFPCGLMEKFGMLFKKTDFVTRLCGSLQIDIGKARSLLGWEPPVNIQEGLKLTAEAFQSEMLETK